MLFKGWHKISYKYVFEVVMLIRLIKIIQTVFVIFGLLTSSTLSAEEYVKLAGVSGEAIVPQLLKLIDRSKVDREIPGLFSKLDLIFEDMKQIKEFYYSVHRTQFANPDRHSDFYLPIRKAIILTEEWHDLVLKAEPVSQKCAELHQQKKENVELQQIRETCGVVNRILQLQTSIFIHTLLGAAGYNDEHYQITLGFYLLSHLFSTNQVSDQSIEHQVNLFSEENRYFLIQIISEIFDVKKTTKIDYEKLANGGSGGTTGGGDFLSLYTKIKLIEMDHVYNLIDQKCKDESDIIATISNVACELWPRKYDYVKYILNLKLESSKETTLVDIIDFNTVKIKKDLLFDRIYAEFNSLDDSIPEHAILGALFINIQNKIIQR